MLIDKRKIKVKHSKRRTKVVELEDTTEERTNVEIIFLYIFWIDCSLD